MEAALSSPLNTPRLLSAAGAASGKLLQIKRNSWDQGQEASV